MLLTPRQRVARVGAWLRLGLISPLASEGDEEEGSGQNRGAGRLTVPAAALYVCSQGFCYDLVAGSSQIVGVLKCF